MKYVRKLVDNYCILDLETTGFSPVHDDVIEVAIMKVRNNEVIDTYHSLTNTDKEINSFIQSLTGISHNMVSGRPSFISLKDEILSFIGDDIVLGHRTSFDTSFVQTKFNVELPNEYIDTYQLSRKIYPELESHSLSSLCEEFGIEIIHHRASFDCEATKLLYEMIKNKLSSENTTLEELYKRKHPRLDIDSIVPESDLIDEDNFFYKKHCVFTGVLEKMVRKDAMQLVVNVGGILDKSVTKSTNYLILGNNDYCHSIKDGKSSKHKKAESLRLKGQDITIIDETMFYELLKIK